MNKLLAGRSREGLAMCDMTAAIGREVSCSRNVSQGPSLLSTCFMMTPVS